jgi:hypothetical protein
MGTLQAYPGPVNGGLRLLAPRYLQQDFLLFAEHFASIAGFEAFLPFAAAFLTAFLRSFFHFHSPPFAFALVDSASWPFKAA